VACHPQDSAETQLATVKECLASLHIYPLTADLDHHPDIHFVNSLDESLQIENVRDLLGQMAMSPYQSALSSFVIFHINTASAPAQHALLKSLEEPPAHVQFILTTTAPEQVLPTILSRCLIWRGETDHNTEKIRAASETKETDIPTLFQQLTTANFEEIFAISEKYKDRADATQMLEQLIHYLHGQNKAQPNKTLVTHMQKLIAAHELLPKNVNVRLVLENALFSIATQKNEKT
jgi:DNA polymerase III gamma/tau subunit